MSLQRLLNKVEGLEEREAGRASPGKATAAEVARAMACLMDEAARCGCGQCDICQRAAQVAKILRTQMETKEVAK